MKVIIQVDMFDERYNSISRPLCKFRPGDKVLTECGRGRIKRIALGRAFVILERRRTLPGLWFDLNELTKENN